MSFPVVLINPPVNKVIEEYDAPPYGHIGLAYLGAALRKQGINCRIIDAKLNRLDFETVVKDTLDLGPTVVGITSFTHEVATAVELAKAIKEQRPNIKTVIGGVHASLCPEDTLKSFNSFDYLVKGEAEFTFGKLAEAIINGRSEAIPLIAGVGGRNNGTIFFNPSGDWIRELDEISFPVWELFGPIKIFPVISSRGCPYRCVFCAKMLGDKIRLRSPGNVVAELKMLQEKFGAKKIYFFDETFGFYREWLMKFLDLLTSNGLHRKLSWDIITRAQILNSDILKRLKKAGCAKIDFGVESGNPEILKIIKKGETKEDFIRAAGLIKKAGIKSHSYFILGHPYETKKTARDTINFAAELNTDYISIGIMIPYPGTEVALMASKGEGGYRKLSSNWADYNKQLGNALELESISRAELTKLQLLGYLKFYLKNFKFFSLIRAGWRYRKLVIAIFVKYIRQLQEV